MLAEKRDRQITGGDKLAAERGRVGNGRLRFGLGLGLGLGFGLGWRRFGWFGFDLRLDLRLDLVVGKVFLEILFGFLFERGIQLALRFFQRALVRVIAG